MQLSVPSSTLPTIIIERGSSIGFRGDWPKRRIYFQIGVRKRWICAVIPRKDLRDRRSSQLQFCREFSRSGCLDPVRYQPRGSCSSPPCLQMFAGKDAQHPATHEYADQWRYFPLRQFGNHLYSNGMIYHAIRSADASAEEHGSAARS